MTSGSEFSVRLQRQIGEDGPHEKASAYISPKDWHWLREELASGLNAGDEIFHSVTPADVIERNKASHG
ncbi:hypothetical protein [Rhizobium sp.]